MAAGPQKRSAVHAPSAGASFSEAGPACGQGLGSGGCGPEDASVPVAPGTFDPFSSSATLSLLSSFAPLPLLLRLSHLDGPTCPDAGRDQGWFRPGGPDAGLKSSSKRGTDHFWHQSEPFFSGLDPPCERSVAACSG